MCVLIIAHGRRCGANVTAPYFRSKMKDYLVNYIYTIKNLLS